MPIKWRITSCRWVLQTRALSGWLLLLLAVWRKHLTEPGYPASIAHSSG